MERNVNEQVWKREPSGNDSRELYEWLARMEGEAGCTVGGAGKSGEKRSVEEIGDETTTKLAGN